MRSKVPSDDQRPTSQANEQNEIKSKPAYKTSRSRRTFLGEVTAATVAAGLVGLQLGQSDASAQFRLPDDTGGGGAIPICPAGCEEGPLTGVARADTARQRRVSAADYERNMTIPSHPCNGDEVRYAGYNYFASYSKGMPHPNYFGEVDSNAYCTYLRALLSGKPSDFELIPLGCGACGTQGPADASGTINDDESRLAPPEAAAQPQQRRL